MTKEIYKSNRYFTVFDFKISHGQLLLRSNKNDDNTFNIDIIFKGVRYMQLFTLLHGISIKIVGRFDNVNDIVSYNSVILFLSHEENQLFEVETRDERFYIAASNCVIYENELDFNETSLGLEKEINVGKQIAGT